VQRPFRHFAHPVCDVDDQSRERARPLLRSHPKVVQDQPDANP
jgi:hypothetical protein